MHPHQRRGPFFRAFFGAVRATRPLEVRQNFVNQPLTFTVQVTCVDDLARLLDQPTDDRELLPGLGTRAQLPLHRDDRNVLGTP